MNPDRVLTLLVNLSINGPHETLALAEREEESDRKRDRERKKERKKERERVRKRTQKCYTVTQLEMEGWRERER